MPRVPAPPMTPSPMYVPPLSATPDPRSFFVGLTYSFLPLPETPMAARRADPRVGHFTTAFTDLSEVRNPSQRVHFVNRWRLEKKDPAAALSEPVKPIVFWMDKNIPLRYRKAVEEGILEWNKAFEKVGFKNAVQARQQPDDATWDNMDAGHASIRWFLGADVGFAIGPSWTDPRTGEIMDADIGMSDVFARGARRQITELVAPRASTAFTEEAPAPVARAPLSRHQHGDSCSYMHDAAAQMHFAMDLMEARGDLAPDSPEAEAFVHEVIRDTIMHEVGHTLGLRHNFKASTVITPEQLQDPAFVAKHGVTGSVMDYNALNLPAKGERRTALNPQSLGAYDYWAIEYAYRPFAAQDEAKGLAQIASRSTEPMLAFNTDEDADNYDPTVNRFDLSSDPLAFAKKQVQLARDLGFASLWFPQHYLAAPSQMLQLTSVMPYLMAHAGQMTVGSDIIILPLQNPVALAEEALKDLPDNAKLTPSDLLNRVKGVYDPGRYRTTVINPSSETRGSFYQGMDNPYYDKPTGIGKPLGNGHAVIDNVNFRGRPVAKWIPIYGEDAKPEMEEIRRELFARVGPDRAKRIADTNRNLVIFPNLVINDGSSVTVRTFYPEGVDKMHVMAWALGPVEETQEQRARRLHAFLSERLQLSRGGDLKHPGQNGRADRRIRAQFCDNRTLARFLLRK